MTATSVVVVLLVVVGVLYMTITPEFAFDGDSVLQGIVESIGDSLEDAVGNLGR